MPIRHTCPACRARSFTHAPKRAMCAKTWGSTILCPHCGAAVCVSKSFGMLYMLFESTLSFPLLIIGFLFGLQFFGYLGLGFDGRFFYIAAAFFLGAWGLCVWFLSTSLYRLLVPLKVAKK